MKAKLQKIGNSKGILIPKAMIDEIGLETAVELSIENNRLIISPIRATRAGWETAFQASEPELAILPDDMSNAFDDAEWTW